MNKIKTNITTELSLTRKSDNKNYNEVKLSDELIIAYYAPIQWLYINSQEETNLNSLKININYYD